MESDQASRFNSGDHETIQAVERTIRTVVRQFRGEPKAVQDDLCQEAMVRVFFAVTTGRYRGDASLSTFAGNVAKFTYLEFVRRRRAQRGLAESQQHNLPTPAASAETLMIREEELQASLRATAQLPPDSLELLRLIFVERLPYPDVAARLGISEGTLRVRLHRCRSRLAEALALERRAESDSPTRGSRGHAPRWRLREQQAD